MIVVFVQEKKKTNDAKTAMKNAFLFSIKADMPDLPVSSRRRMAAAPIARPSAPVMIDGVSWSEVFRECKTVEAKNDSDTDLHRLMSVIYVLIHRWLPCVLHAYGKCLCGAPWVTLALEESRL